jgi:cell division protein FtsX
MTDQLHIQDQPRLPLAQQAGIVLDGLRHRFTRVLLTLLVVMLAVAFVCYVITEQRAVQANLAATKSTLSRFDDLNRFLGWLSGPNDNASLQRRLAQVPQNAWDIPFLADSLKIPLSQTQSLADDAKAWESIQAWFDGLPLGQRRVLFGSTHWAAALERLDAPEAVAQGAWETGARLPENLLALTRTRARYQAALTAASTGLQALNAHLSDQLRQPSLIPFLADSASARQTLQQAGFAIAPQALQNLQSDARAYQGVSALAKSKTKTAQPTNPDYASASAPATASSENLRDALSQANTLQSRIFNRYPSASGPDRTNWLIAVSFLVCLAGITNAMLVSVLERFREIATMKCLGAMDGFIATIFIAEASLIGILGGIAGALLGTLAGLTRVAWALGFQSLDPIAPSAIGLIVLQGVLAGWLLTVLSSIYPSFAAARMPPMAAMRVD